MPDYSDDEIDKVSDDVSESDEVLIDGKPVKNKYKSGSDAENVSDWIRWAMDKNCAEKHRWLKCFFVCFVFLKNNYNGSSDYLRNRLAKHGHDNPAFLDDANVNAKIRRG